LDISVNISVTSIPPTPVSISTIQGEDPDQVDIGVDTGEETTGQIDVDIDGDTTGEVNIDMDEGTTGQINIRF
jgi:uncharacterized protein YciU (UPF0263 family)